jgi:lysyl-tRNA synthetase class 2
VPKARDRQAAEGQAPPQAAANAPAPAAAKAPSAVAGKTPAPAASEIVRHPWVDALRKRGEFIPRIAALLTFVAGMVSVFSAVTPAYRSRLHNVRHLLGPGVPETAAGSTAAFGIALMLLSYGLRRRQRRAWIATLVLAVIITILHLAKGLDVEEASLCVALIVVLVLSRSNFRAAASVPPQRVRLTALTMLFAVDIGFGLFLIRENGHTLRGNPHLGSKLWQVLLGFIGVRGPLNFGSHQAGNTVHAVLAGLGAISLLTALSVILVRPPGPPRRSADQEAALSALLRSHGEQDSLAYFANRDDRQLILSPSGKSAVSFRVVGGVALAAGDPLGDPEAWPGAIDAFLTQAGTSAWVPAVMGCSERGGTAWSRAGLDALELGDEAVVYATEFSLEGRSMRGVRQACGRIERAGYTMQVRRCGDVDRAEWAQLVEAAKRWRQGGVERGFSMALGRLGDPREANGMIATAHDAEGRLRALLQFVPWGKKGLSLDVMRRDPASDNGVNEALIVAVLGRCTELGVERVSLNFAVFRSALERGAQLGAGPIARAWRKLLIIGSKWWQIEQLARFNAKFEPRWIPRYMCYPGSLEIPSVAIAALRAEAFIVLPSFRRKNSRTLEPQDEEEPLCR